MSAGEPSGPRSTIEHGSTAEQWLAAYGRASETHDGIQAAALFTEEGIYCWGPFEPALVGQAAIRERWRQATSQHGEVRFTANPIGAEKARVFARWQAVLQPPGASGDIGLDGIFVLDFAPDGRCASLQEWWMTAPGQR